MDSFLRFAAIVTALCFSSIGQTTERPNEQIAAASSPSEARIERKFVSGPFGQVHVRVASPDMIKARPPVVLFHPTPYSSNYFNGFMKDMAKDRMVIAIDTPGYGDSDSPESLPTIRDYAESAASALDSLGSGLIN